MTHVVCQPCYGAGCRLRRSARWRPLREAENMLYIDPGVCIDCQACVSVCPVNAIFLDEKVPQQWRSYIWINAQQAALFPMINRKKKIAGDSSREQ